jgi:hypothetical protein
MLSEMVAADGISSILFWPTLICRSEAGQQIETFAGNGPRRAFRPAVILFISLPTS